MAPWRSWRCFWLHNHASQGKAVALVTTGTCVSSEQKGTCRPASSWRAREQSMNPTHQRGDSYLRVRNLGIVSGGRWRPLCHMTDTQRLFRGGVSLKASVSCDRPTEGWSTGRWQHFWAFIFQPFPSQSCLHGILSLCIWDCFKIATRESLFQASWPSNNHLDLQTQLFKKQTYEIGITYYLPRRQILQSYMCRKKFTIHL